MAMPPGSEREIDAGETHVTAIANRSNDVRGRNSFIVSVYAPCQKARRMMLEA